MSVATLSHIDAHISLFNKNSLAYTHLQSTGVKWCICWTQHPRFLLWSLFWTCRSSRDAGIRRTQSGSAHQWRRLNRRFPFRCHSLNITLTIKSCQTPAPAALLKDYPAMKCVSKSCGWVWGGTWSVVLMMLRDLAGDTEGRTHEYIFVGGTEMKNSGVE